VIVREPRQCHDFVSMLADNLHKKPFRILGAGLFLCCAMGVAHGDDTNAPSTPSTNSRSPVVQPPAQSYSPVVRDARYYLRSTWSVRNIVEGGVIAGVPNLTSAPVQPQPPTVVNEQTADAYGDAMEQYSAGMDDWRRANEDELRYRGRRFGFGLATAETRDLLSNFVLPVALRQDPRYVPPSFELPLESRLGYAAASVFVTNDNAGRRVPNYSKWIGTVGAALIAKHLYASPLGVPQLNTNRFIWRYVGYSLAGDEATNLAHELLRASLSQDLIRIDREGNATDSNYYPLSTAGTVLSWVRDIYAPRNFIQGALIAGVPNLPSEPDYPVEPPLTSKAAELAYAEAVEQYGTDMETWRRTTDEEVRYRGRRFIGGFSESETQQFLSGCLIPLTFRVDPRFIPTGGGQGMASRLGNAFTQLAVAHTNSGNRTLNLPLLGGTVGAAFTAQHLYYDRLGVPELTTNRLVAKTIAFNLAGDLLLNLFHEFSPHRGF
jgi:hypothetical protein